MIILLNNIKACFLKITKKAEFGKATILVFVSFDTDALCALKILIELFKMENLLFRVLPVSGYTEMCQAIEDSKQIQEVRSMIFLNCGAIYDMTQFWFAQQDSPIKTFIFDNHQPTYIANIHSEKMIYVINDGLSEMQNCPDENDTKRYEQLLNEDYSDEDDVIEDSNDQDSEKSLSAVEIRKQSKFILKQNILAKEYRKMRKETYFNISIYSFIDSSRIQKKAYLGNQAKKTQEKIKIIGMQ